MSPEASKPEQTKNPLPHAAVKALGHDAFHAAYLSQPDVRPLQWESEEAQTIIAAEQSDTASILRENGQAVMGVYELEGMAEARRKYAGDEAMQASQINMYAEIARKDLGLAATTPEEDTGISLTYRTNQILDEAEAAGLSVNREVAEPTGAAINWVETATDEEIEQFLKCHVEAEQQRQAEQAAEFTKIKSDYVTAMAEAVHDGRLPSSIDVKKVEGHLGSLKIVQMDALSAGLPAVYEGRSHSIVLSSAINMKDVLAKNFIYESDGEKVGIDHIFGHEASHAVSTKIIVAGIEDEGSSPVVRNGLSFTAQEKAGVNMSGKDLYAYYHRLAFMDEYANEITTMRALGREDSPARKPERHLMELVRTKGHQEVPEDWHIEAKFEDFDADKPAGEQTPLWYRLTDAYGKAYDDPDFVAKLDDFVRETSNREDDLDMAIEFFEKLKHGQYNQSGYSFDDFRQAKAAEHGLAASATWAEIKAE
jgi:hypothetical protein